MAMTLKPYETLRKFLLVSDNDSRNNTENLNDKLFKMRPLLDLVRNNCIKIEPERNHSIDEQIIPAKTKCSGGAKLYNMKKIHKWGFKNMGRAGQSWIVYNFFIYDGKHSAGAERCGTEESLLRFVVEIPKTQNYQVFLNYWFSTLPILIKLQFNGILPTATLLSDPLISIRI